MQLFVVLITHITIYISKQLLKAAKSINPVYTKQKCTFLNQTLNVLGNAVSNSFVGPDPDQLKPLQHLPQTSKAKNGPI